MKSQIRSGARRALNLVRELRLVISTVKMTAVLMISEMRFERRSRRAQLHSNDKTMLSLSNLEIFVINLKNRPEKYRRTQRELKSAGFERFTRFQANAHKIPAAGCSDSHSQVLRMASGSEAVMVCEDDIEFVAAPKEIRDTIQEFLEDPLLDVMCLGNVLLAQPIKYTNRIYRSHNVQTTSCYIAKPRALPLLSKSFAQSAFRLEAGLPASRFAADIYWKKLQKGPLVFCVPRKKMVRQIPGWSDIEKSKVDYFEAEFPLITAREALFRKP